MNADGSIRTGEPWAGAHGCEDSAACLAILWGTSVSRWPRVL